MSSRPIDEGERAGIKKKQKVLLGPRECKRGRNVRAGVEGSVPRPGMTIFISNATNASNVTNASNATNAMNAMNTKAFSLIELMVAVAILSTGLVLIYEAFFLIADVTNSMPYYIKTQMLIDEEIWKEETALRISGYLFPEARDGFMSVGDKNVQLDKEIKVLDALQGLYQIDMDFSWESGSKVIKNVNSLYIRR